MFAPTIMLNIYESLKTAFLAYFKTPASKQERITQTLCCVHAAVSFHMLRMLQRSTAGNSSYHRAICKADSEVSPKIILFARWAN